MSAWSRFLCCQLWAILILFLGCHNATMGGHNNVPPTSPPDLSLDPPALETPAEDHLAPNTMPLATFFPFHTPPVVVQLEIVDSPSERAQGLMYREEMGSHEGMIFVFPEEKILTFWMKNTYLPLDMIFLDSTLKVVGIVANAEPETLTSRTVGIPSQYVIEVNAGFTAANHIVSGVQAAVDHVVLEVSE